MITKTFLIFLACAVGFLAVQKTIAARASPNIEDFMEENHRTRSRTRPDYLAPSVLDEELTANIDNFATVPEAIDADSSPGELTSQILGCANMIRNDMIYSDDSIRTTIRKKGNIRKKNVNAKTVPPCSCSSKRHSLLLGQDYFPTRLETLICNNDTSCDRPFRCKAINYWVTVLKRLTPGSSIDVPVDFRRWEPQNVNVTTFCLCAADE